MKFLIAAAVVLFAGMAHAEEQTSKPAERPRHFTIDEINKALEARGQRPLYSSRVLHDDNAGSTRTHSTITIRSR